MMKKFAVVLVGLIFVLSLTGLAIAQEKAKPAAEPADLARVKESLKKLQDEVEELRGENDFLNGEVARYVQKNKDLAAQIASLKEA